MALSVGEVEATIRLRDEMSARLSEVRQRTRSLGTDLDALASEGSRALADLAAGMILLQRSQSQIRPITADDLIGPDVLPRLQAVRAAITGLQAEVAGVGSLNLGVTGNGAGAAAASVAGAVVPGFGALSKVLSTANAVINTIKAIESNASAAKATGAAMSELVNDLGLGATKQRSSLEKVAITLRALGQAVGQVNENLGLMIQHFATAVDVYDLATNRARQFSMVMKAVGSSVLQVAQTVEKVAAGVYQTINTLLELPGKIKSRLLDPITERLSSLGKKLSLGLSAPLIAFGGLAAKSAMDFERALVDMAATVDGVTDATGRLTEFGADLSRQLRGLSRNEIPLTAVELARVAEIGGELGVQSGNILKFTKTVAMMGSATNLGLEGSAQTLARLGTMLGVSQDNYFRLASVITMLGEKSGATADQVTEMTARLSAAGRAAGMSVSDVLAFSAAVARSSGDADAGAMALNKLFATLYNAAKQGGDQLEALAEVAGVSGKAFQRMFATSPARAIAEFVAGLGRVAKAGGDVFGTLKDVDFQEARVRQALIKMAMSEQVLAKFLGMANREWATGNYLADEARAKWATTSAQLGLLWNRVKGLAQVIGTAMLPGVRAAIALFSALEKPVKALADLFGSLPGPLQLVVFGLVGVAAAIGPVILGILQLGKIYATLSVLSLFNTALGLTSGKFDETRAAMSGVFSFLKPLAQHMLDLIDRSGALTRSVMAMGGGLRPLAIGFGHLVVQVLSVHNILLMLRMSLAGTLALFGKLLASILRAVGGPRLLVAALIGLLLSIRPVRQALGQLMEVLRQLWQLALRHIVAAFENVKKAGQELVKFFVDLWQWLVLTVPGFEHFADMMKSVGSGLANLTELLKSLNGEGYVSHTVVTLLGIAIAALAVRSAIGGIVWLVKTIKMLGEASGGAIRWLFGLGGAAKGAGGAAGGLGAAVSGAINWVRGFGAAATGASGAAGAMGEAAHEASHWMSGLGHVFTVTVDAARKVSGAVTTTARSLFGLEVASKGAGGAAATAGAAADRAAGWLHWFGSAATRAGMAAEATGAAVGKTTGWLRVYSVIARMAGSSTSGIGTAAGAATKWLLGFGAAAKSTGAAATASGTAIKSATGWLRGFWAATRGTTGAVGAVEAAIAASVRHLRTFGTAAKETSTLAGAVGRSFTAIGAAMAAAWSSVKKDERGFFQLSTAKKLVVEAADAIRPAIRAVADEVSLAGVFVGRWGMTVRESAVGMLTFGTRAGDLATSIGGLIGRARDLWGAFVSAAPGVAARTLVRFSGTIEGTGRVLEAVVWRLVAVGQASRMLAQNLGLLRRQWFNAFTVALGVERGLQALARAYFAVETPVRAAAQAVREFYRSYVLLANVRALVSLPAAGFEALGRAVRSAAVAISGGFVKATASLRAWSQALPGAWQAAGLVLRSLVTVTTVLGSFAARGVVFTAFWVGLTPVMMAASLAIRTAQAAVLLLGAGLEFLGVSSRFLIGWVDRTDNGINRLVRTFARLRLAASESMAGLASGARLAAPRLYAVAAAFGRVVTVGVQYGVLLVYLGRQGGQLALQQLRMASAGRKVAEVFGSLIATALMTITQWKSLAGILGQFVFESIEVGVYALRSGRAMTSLAGYVENLARAFLRLIEQGEIWTIIARGLAIVPQEIARGFARLAAALMSTAVAQRVVASGGALIGRAWSGVQRQVAIATGSFWAMNAGMNESRAAAFLLSQSVRLALRSIVLFAAGGEATLRVAGGAAVRMGAAIAGAAARAMQGVQGFLIWGQAAGWEMRRTGEASMVMARAVRLGLLGLAGFAKGAAAGIGHMANLALWAQARLERLAGASVALVKYDAAFVAASARWVGAGRAVANTATQITRALLGAGPAAGGLASAVGELATTEAAAGGVTTALTTVRGRMTLAMAAQAVKSRVLAAGLWLVTTAERGIIALNTLLLSSYAKLGDVMMSLSLQGVEWTVMQYAMRSTSPLVQNLISLFRVLGRDFMVMMSVVGPGLSMLPPLFSRLQLAALKAVGRLVLLKAEFMGLTVAGRAVLAVHRLLVAAMDLTNVASSRLKVAMYEATRGTLKFRLAMMADRVVWAFGTALTNLTFAVYRAYKSIEVMHGFLHFQFRVAAGEAANGLLYLMKTTKVTGAVIVWLGNLVLGLSRVFNVFRDVGVFTAMLAEVASAAKKWLLLEVAMQGVRVVTFAAEEAFIKFMSVARIVDLALMVLMDRFWALNAMLRAYLAANVDARPVLELMAGVVRRIGVALLFQSAAAKASGVAATALTSVLLAHNAMYDRTEVALRTLTLTLYRFADTGKVAYRAARLILAGIKEVRYAFEALRIAAWIAWFSALWVTITPIAAAMELLSRATLLLGFRFRGLLDFTFVLMANMHATSATIRVASKDLYLLAQQTVLGRVTLVAFVKGVQWVASSLVALAWRVRESAVVVALFGKQLSMLEFTQLVAGVAAMTARLLGLFSALRLMERLGLGAAAGTEALRRAERGALLGTLLFRRGVVDLGLALRDSGGSVLRFGVLVAGALGRVVRGAAQFAVFKSAALLLAAPVAAMQHSLAVFSASSDHLNLVFRRWTRSMNDLANNTGFLGKAIGRLMWGIVALGSALIQLLLKAGALKAAFGQLSLAGAVGWFRRLGATMIETVATTRVVSAVLNALGNVATFARLGGALAMAAARFQGLRLVLLSLRPQVFAGDLAWSAYIETAGLAERMTERLARRVAFMDTTTVRYAVSSRLLAAASWAVGVAQRSYLAVFNSVIGASLLASRATDAYGLALLRVSMRSMAFAFSSKAAAFTMEKVTDAVLVLGAALRTLKFAAVMTWSLGLTVVFTSLATVLWVVARALAAVGIVFPGLLREGARLANWASIFAGKTMVATVQLMRLAEMSRLAAIALVAIGSVLNVIWKVVDTVVASLVSAATGFGVFGRAGALLRAVVLALQVQLFVVRARLQALGLAAVATGRALAVLAAGQLGLLLARIRALGPLAVAAAKALWAMTAAAGRSAMATSVTVWTSMVSGATRFGKVITGSVIPAILRMSTALAVAAINQAKLFGAGVASAFVRKGGGGAAAAGATAAGWSIPAGWAGAKILMGGAGGAGGAAGLAKGLGLVVGALAKFALIAAAIAEVIEVVGDFARVVWGVISQNKTWGESFRYVWDAVMKGDLAIMEIISMLTGYETAVQRAKRAQKELADAAQEVLDEVSGEKLRKELLAIQKSFEDMGPKAMLDPQRIEALREKVRGLADELTKHGIDYTKEGKFKVLYDMMEGHFQDQLKKSVDAVNKEMARLETTAPGKGPQQPSAWTNARIGIGEMLRLDMTKARAKALDEIREAENKNTVAQTLHSKALREQVFIYETLAKVAGQMDQAEVDAGNSAIELGRSFKAAFGGDEKAYQKALDQMFELSPTLIVLKKNVLAAREAWEKTRDSIKGPMGKDEVARMDKVTSAFAESLLVAMKGAMGLSTELQGIAREEPSVSEAFERMRAGVYRLSVSHGVPFKSFIEQAARIKAAVAMASGELKRQIVSGYKMVKGDKPEETILAELRKSPALAKELEELGKKAKFESGDAVLMLTAVKEEAEAAASGVEQFLARFTGTEARKNLDLMTDKLKAAFAAGKKPTELAIDQIDAYLEALQTVRMYLGKVPPEAEKMGKALLAAWGPAKLGQDRAVALTDAVKRVYLVGQARSAGRFVPTEELTGLQEAAKKVEALYGKTFEDVLRESQAFADDQDDIISNAMEGLGRLVGHQQAMDQIAALREEVASMPSEFDRALVDAAALDKEIADLGVQSSWTTAQLNDVGLKAVVVWSRIGGAVSQATLDAARAWMTLNRVPDEWLDRGIPTADLAAGLKLMTERGADTIQMVAGLKEELRELAVPVGPDTLARRLDEVARTYDEYRRQAAGIKAMGELGPKELDLVERFRKLYDIDLLKASSAEVEAAITRTQAMAAKRTAEEWIRSFGETQSGLEELARDAAAAYAEMVRSGRDGSNELRAAWEKMVEANIATLGEFGQRAVQVLEGISGSFGDGLTAILDGSKSFAEAFVDVWRGIRSALAQVFGDIFKTFVRDLLLKMLTGLNKLGGQVSEGVVNWVGTAAGGGQMFGGLAGGPPVPQAQGGLSYQGLSGLLGGTVAPSFAVGGIGRVAMPNFRSLQPAATGSAQATAQNTAGLFGLGNVLKLSTHAMKILTGVLGAVGMGLSALGTYQSAKQGNVGGMMGGIASGAMSGAMLGSVVPVIGTAVGAVLGALVAGIGAMFAGTTPHYQQVMNSIGRDFGVTVTEDLAKQIASVSEQLQKEHPWLPPSTAPEAQGKGMGILGVDKLSDYYAALTKLSDVVQAGGGAITFGLERTFRMANDLITLVRQGIVSVKQAGEGLQGMFADLAEAATDANGMVSESFKQLVSDSQKWNVSFTAMTDWVNSQAEKLAASTGKMVAALASTAKGLFDDAYKAAVKSLNLTDATVEDTLQKLWDALGTDDSKKVWAEVFGGMVEPAQYAGKTVEELTALLEKMRASGRYTARDFANVKAALDAAIASGGKMGGLGSIASKVQDSFDRMSHVVATSLAGLLKMGQTPVQAMAALGDQIDTLVSLYDKLGPAGLKANATFEVLKRYRTLVKDNQAVVDSISNIGDALTVLANFNVLDQGTFTDLLGEQVDEYNTLIAKGFTQNEVLGMMVPALKTIKHLYEEHGFAIDTVTESLLKAAEAQGLLTEAGEEMNRMMIEGLAAIITALGGKLPASFVKFLKTVNDELDNMGGGPAGEEPGAGERPGGGGRGGGDYQQSTSAPALFAAGGRVLRFVRGGKVPTIEPKAVRYLADGMAAARVIPFVPKGTDTVPAMLTPGEVVLNAAQQKAVAGAIGGGTTTITIQVQVDASQAGWTPQEAATFARELAARLPDEIQKGGKVQAKWRRAMKVG